MVELPKAGGGGGGAALERHGLTVAASHCLKGELPTSGGSCLVSSPRHGVALATAKHSNIEVPLETRQTVVAFLGFAVVRRFQRFLTIISGSCQILRRLHTLQFEQT